MQPCAGREDKKEHGIAVGRNKKNGSPVPAEALQAPVRGSSVRGLLVVSDDLPMDDPLTDAPLTDINREANCFFYRHLPVSCPRRIQA